MSDTTDVHWLLQPLRRIHEEIRAAVVAACEEAVREQSEHLAEVAEEAEGDTIYAVDRVSEERLVHLFESEMKEDRRSRARPHHEERPPASWSPAVETAGDPDTA